MRYCLTLSLVIVSILVAKERASGADDTAANDEEKQARAKAVLEHMQTMTMQRTSANARQPVALIDHPLLTYTDPVRANDHGTVWAWGTGGRPLALIEVFQPSGQMQRIHAITLTSSDQVELTIDTRRTWSPRSTGLEFQKIETAPQPAAREVTRLGQLKELARRFEAHEFWDPDNSRFELRLLVQPIYRYKDSDHKIVDGAVFLFAHGTNPEVALLIEAQGDSPADAEWHFGLSRLGSAEMHVSLKEEEVWKQARTPNIVGQPSEPYWLFWTDITRVTPKAP